MTDAEAAFWTRWRQLDGPMLERELRFAPPRRWRFDFACPDAWVAIEVDGGAYTQGRHTRGKGYENDCEKLNAATVLGWAVFRVTPGMIERDPVGVLTPMIALCNMRAEAPF